MSNADKPASPRSGYELSNLADHQFYYHEDGLTKREIFAMAAMQGIIAAYDREDVMQYPEFERTAQAAVRYADELLIQLGKD